MWIIPLKISGTTQVLKTVHALILCQAAAKLPATVWWKHAAALTCAAFQQLIRTFSYKNVNIRTSHLCFISVFLHWTQLKYVFRRVGRVYPVEALSQQKTGQSISQELFIDLLTHGRIKQGGKWFRLLRWEQTRIKGHKLQQGRFWLELVGKEKENKRKQQQQTNKKTPSQQLHKTKTKQNLHNMVLSSRRGCPERLWVLCCWSISKLAWTGKLSKLD